MTVGVQIRQAQTRIGHFARTSCRGLRTQAHYGYDSREELSDTPPLFPRHAGLSTPRQVLSTVPQSIQ